MSQSLRKPSAELKRYPHRKLELLQAWDAADELLIEHLETTDLTGKRILICNDSFGALSVSLMDFSPTVFTDSFVSAEATRRNSESRVDPVNSLEQLSGIYDLILIRVPKNMSFFEDLLCRITPHLQTQSKIICGYMVKHQAKASFNLLEKLIGNTTTSLAQKKARLIFADFERKRADSPFPTDVQVPGFPEPFLNHSNLFSREKLDIGTRFFLEHLPKEDHSVALDIGCANGMIGIRAKQKNLETKVIFTDDSKMALLSAEENWKRHFPSARSGSAEFLWTNGYEDGEPNTVGLVLCNPPFHQGTARGDFIAHQMFTDAKRVLIPGGLLRVIGNTHLHYPTVLRKLFGNAEVVATNAKFTIVDAFKSGD